MVGTGVRDTIIRFHYYRFRGAYAPEGGTGIGDLGDISLMPVVGEVTLAKGELPDPTSGLYSFFSHKKRIGKSLVTIQHVHRYH